MQINRNMSAVITNNQLLRTENRLAASMERLSSGLKINHASDNPAGIAISNKMKAQIDALDQAEANASDATSVIQIADGALGEVTNIVQRMRELSVQAANGVYSYSDRQSIQAEIEELKIEVNRISRDTEYNTKTLLDGSSDIRVYGKDGSRYCVSDTVPAQNYRVNVEELGKQATVEIDYKAAEAGGLISINGVSANIVSGMSKEKFLHEVRTAAEQGGCNVAINETGDKLLITSNYYGYDESLEVSMTTELADTLGVDANDACEYVIHESSLKFGPNAPSVDGTIRIDGSEVNITADMTLDEYYSAIVNAAVRNGYKTSINADGILEVSTDESSDSMEFAFSGKLVNALSIKENYRGEYQINTTGNDAVVTIPTDLDNSGFTNTTTVETEGNRVTISDNNGFSIDFLLNDNYVPEKDEVNGNFEIEVTDIGSMTIQIGSNEHQTMEISISEVSTSSLYIDTVDVVVTNGAERAMNTLDEALAKLSATRSKLGAFQNRLDYAVSSLSTTGENITAAYSGLMDTDMATEMAEYTQQNILNQAAISVLSQANELPQQVLSLLQ